MADYSLLNDPEMAEIFESFVVETKETLEKLDLDLVQLESSPQDADLLNEIFRSFHTVKGTSGFLGLVKMQALTHRLEDILNKLRKGEAQVTSQIMDGILSGYDSLGELLEVVETDKNEDYDTGEAILELEKILKNISNSGNEVSQKSVVEEVVVKEEIAVAEKEVVVEEVTIEDEQVVETVVPKVEEKEIIDFDEEELQKAFIEANKILQSENKNDLVIAADQVEVVDMESDSNVVTQSSEPTEVDLKLGKDKTLSKNEVNDPPKPKPAEKKPLKTAIEQTIRVEVERLDELLNLVSELVLGRNRLAQLNTDVSKDYEGTELARNLGDTARQIDLLTTELQLAVMKTRMIKIGKVFNRFPRLVRS